MSGNMFSGIGEGINLLIKTWVIMLVVAVPLAIWKLVDIIIWIVNHINVVVN